MFDLTRTNDEGRADEANSQKWTKRRNLLAFLIQIKVCTPNESLRMPSQNVKQILIKQIQGKKELNLTQPG